MEATAYGMKDELSKIESFFGLFNDDLVNTIIFCIFAAK